MNHCEDCKHFVARIEDTFVDPPSSFGMCAVTETRPSKPGNPSRLAFAQDAEEYNAWLVVSPDFGCIQFEPKEQG